MNDLFDNSFEQLARLLGSAYPLSKATLENAFAYNHAHNVAGLGANLRVLSQGQAMPGAPVLSRVMLESSYHDDFNNPPAFGLHGALRADLRRRLHPLRSRLPPLATLTALRKHK